MSKLAKPILLQGTFFAALGLGAHMLRKFSKEPVHHLVAENESLMKFETIAQSVSQMGNLKDDDRFNELVALVESFVKWHEAKLPFLQWHMSKLIYSIQAHGENMCNCASQKLHEDIFRNALNCREETLPQLKSHLEDILHNHLLDRTIM